MVESVLIIIDLIPWPFLKTSLNFLTNAHSFILNCFNEPSNEAVKRYFELEVIAKFHILFL